MGYLNSYLFSLFLTTRFGSGAVKPNPVFGTSTVKQIETNGETSTRDVCHLHLIPNSDGSSTLKTYESADRHKCEENDFKYHDLYHLFVTSAMGQENREITTQIADQLKRYALSRRSELSPQDYHAMRRMRWELVDKDYAEHFRTRWLYENKESNGDALIKDQYALYKTHSKLPLIEGIFQAYVTQRQLMMQGIKSSPDYPVFASDEALEETFTFIANALPNDLEHQDGKNAFAGMIEKVTIEALAEFSKMEQKYLSDPVFRLIKNNLSEQMQTPTMQALKGV